MPAAGLAATLSNILTGEYFFFQTHCLRKHVNITGAQCSFTAHHRCAKNLRYLSNATYYEECCNHERPWSNDNVHNLNRSCAVTGCRAGNVSTCIRPAFRATVNGSGWTVKTAVGYSRTAFTDVAAVVQHCFAAYGTIHFPIQPRCSGDCTSRRVD